MPNHKDHPNTDKRLDGDLVSKDIFDLLYKYAPELTDFQHIKAGEAIQALINEAVRAELQQLIDNEPPYGKWIEYLEKRIAALSKDKEQDNG